MIILLGDKYIIFKEIINFNLSFIYIALFFIKLNF